MTVHSIPVYHPRARERIPAQSDTISLLDLIPLVLESFVIHVLLTSYPPKKGGFLELIRLWADLWDFSDVKRLMKKRQTARDTTVLLKEMQVLKIYGGHLFVSAGYKTLPKGTCQGFPANQGQALAYVRTNSERPPCHLSFRSFFPQQIASSKHITESNFGALGIMIVFALSVEEELPVAGRLALTRHLDSNEDLGISRGNKFVAPLHFYLACRVWP